MVQVNVLELPQLGVTDCLLVLEAATFAADKHRHQRRKDAAGTPYINHPLDVATLLATEVRNLDSRTLAKVLQAALLHDTVEDTDTTYAELVANFGPEVADIVMEVTDDKRLPKAQRKQLQIEHAAGLSFGAKLVKLADKICNVRSIRHSPPVGWTRARKLKYVRWAAAVVAQLKGTYPELDRCFAVAEADLLDYLGGLK